MHKHLTHTLLSLFCVLSFVSFGQKNKLEITLPDSASVISNNARTIVLMETDSFKLVTTYSLFIDNCKQFIKAHNIPMDKELLSFFIDNNSQVIYADSLVKHKTYKDRLIYRIDDLLANQQCIVYNKQKKMLEKVLKVSTYRNEEEHGRILKSKNRQVILIITDGLF